MPGNDAPTSWRSALLSEGHGLAVVAVRDGRVHELNAPARELFHGIVVGTKLEELFEESCRPAASEAVSRESSSSTTTLQVKHARGPLRVRFLVLSGPDEKLLIAAASGVGLADELGGNLMAANSELAKLARELSRRIDEFDTIKQALVRADEAARSLRAELDELGRASNAVSEAVADLPQSDVSAVLTMIALQARALTHADYVALGIGTDEATPFHPWVFLGVPQETAHAIGRFPRPVGTLGTVARKGELVRVADVHRHPDFQGLPPHHFELESFLGVPIQYRGRSVGNLYLGKKSGAPEFSEQDERLIRALASRVAVAIETALLYTSESLQRQWLQNNIDQMPDGVLLYDEHGRLKARNQAIAELVCAEPGRTDPYGNEATFDAREPDGRITPPDELPIVRAIRDEEATFRRELLLRRRDGDFVPVWVSTVPVRDPKDRLSGVVMVVSDISAHRELERLREEWAAVVAHDLRQPLGAIAMTAEAELRLHSGELAEHERRAFERIRSASERLSRMVADLSDASLIESRRLSIEPRSVDVHALVGSVVESLSEATAAYDVRIQAEPGETAWVDPDRIHQVLANLISNAAKYGQSGTEITIEVAAHDDFLELIVTNHGPGIASEDLPFLFGRFTRADDPRRPRAPGLGLGLYIAKGLVEAHGGKIWAESVPGDTTRFHFTMPREVSPAHPRLAHEAAPWRAHQRGRTRRPRVS